MSNPLYLEFPNPSTDTFDVSAMGITSTKELWFMYTTDNTTWETVDPTDPGTISITYVPTKVNKNNPISQVTLGNLPSGITKIVFYRLTDLSELPEFTAGNIHNAATMNIIVDKIRKAMEETRGDAGSIKNILADLVAAKTAAEQYRDEAEGFKNDTEAIKDETKGYKDLAYSYSQDAAREADEAEAHKQTAASSEKGAIANADTVAALYQSVLEFYNFIMNTKAGSPLAGVDGGGAGAFADPNTPGTFILDGGYAVPPNEWGFYAWVDPGDANGSATEDDVNIDDLDGGNATPTTFEDYYDGGGASSAYYKQQVTLE